ncbi:hypothetical protein QGM71_01665 [Virgibacillus sp. C22-A2]|uniref:DUF3679 domain-containing protein n=1 Tax=Virgibacillus tibetensis TaxID=3042313 RepID=A0ABU6KAQ4_9BACI|nr:hypothetical protein [Virgibacillus sp. C22-A2]
MVRSFVVLLLLAVFFLTGVLYGMDRGEISLHDEATKEVELVESQELASTQMVLVEQELDNHNMEEAEHFTQKTASFLEAGVKGFYEVIVQILYQVSQLFF